MINQHKIPLSDQKYILAHLKEINKRTKIDESDTINQERPFIYGSFTNWKPKRMFEIREFCDRINQYKPDVF